MKRATLPRIWGWSRRRRVKPTFIMSSGRSNNIIGEEGHQRQVGGLRQLREDLLELLQIVGAVIARQLDLGQHRLRLAGLASATILARLAG